MKDELTQSDRQALQREIFLGFWKVHILHHASEGPVVGLWMLRELQRHGYEVSPGTLYPLLHRMEKLGWLRCEFDPEGGSRSRKSFFLTPKGSDVLESIRHQLSELTGEVRENHKRPSSGKSARTSKISEGRGST